jgi:hypothetical protein
VDYTIAARGAKRIEIQQGALPYHGRCDRAEREIAAVVSAAATALTSTLKLVRTEKSLSALGIIARIQVEPLASRQPRSLCNVDLRCDRVFDIRM